MVIILFVYCLLLTFDIQVVHLVSQVSVFQILLAETIRKPEELLSVKTSYELTDVIGYPIARLRQVRLRSSF